jgi:hypothetical protein
VKGTGVTGLTTKSLNVDVARRLTDDIKTAVAMTWELIQDAYAGWRDG